ncbi:hypothetical protein Slin15195_G124400 [Septoria linicola]|uniref:Uncharacterized protein n=1 Tax=Septoria linicola TaxID=215465 RepID=A0A9Q9B8Q5_9PEZI|nr:hypothetical protein Slin14017_G080610 [Septoria linicola]USW59121.1 hypothetical protein Slin15195_G124400 [Septoria linicola]
MAKKEDRRRARIIRRQAEYADLTTDAVTWKTIDEDESRALMGLPPKSRSHIDLAHKEEDFDNAAASQETMLASGITRPTHHLPPSTRQYDPSRDPRLRRFSPGPQPAMRPWDPHAYAASNVEFGEVRWLSPMEGALDSSSGNDPPISPRSLYPSEWQDMPIQGSLRSPPRPPPLAHENIPRTVQWHPINHFEALTSQYSQTNTWPVPTTMEYVPPPLPTCDTPPSHTTAQFQSGPESPAQPNSTFKQR